MLHYAMLSWLRYIVREHHTLQCDVYLCYLPSSKGEEDEDKERQETSLSLSEQPGATWRPRPSLPRYAQ